MSTVYIHPADPTLNKLTTSMVYDSTGKPSVRTVVMNDITQPIPVSLNGNDVVITGNVTIPGVVNVASSAENPVHVHVDEIGTSGILTVPWMPIAGNVYVDGGEINVTVASGNVKVFGNVNVAVTSMPAVEISNDSGNPIPVSANASPNSLTNPIFVSTIGGSNQGKLWNMQISQGLIAGYTAAQVTGYNPNTAAGDAVWSASTPYPWSSLVTAQTLYLKSSTNNATDRSMPMLIDGLDLNYNDQTEVVTLDAADSRTPVTSTKQFLRIHSVMCNGANTNVGDITTHVTSGTGTVVSKISAGRGIAQAGVYTVPAGYTGYLFKGDASSTGATVVNFMGRYYSKAFIVLHVAIVDNSTYIYDFPFPMPLPEKTDMYTTIEVGAGKTAVNYEILLVLNT